MLFTGGGRRDPQPQLLTPHTRSTMAPFEQPTSSLRPKPKAGSCQSPRRKHGEKLLDIGLDADFFFLENQKHRRRKQE